MTQRSVPKVVVTVVTTIFAHIYIYIYNVTLLGGGCVCVCLQYIIYTEILYCVCDPTDGIVTGAVMMRLVLAVVWRGERTRFACLTSQTECAII